MKKFSLAIAAALIMIGAFLFGSLYNSLPEGTAKKFFMPDSYRTYLKSTKYSIWFYPNIPKMKEHLPYKSYPSANEILKGELPKVSVKDMNGKLKIPVQNGPRFRSKVAP